MTTHRWSRTRRRAGSGLATRLGLGLTLALLVAGAGPASGAPQASARDLFLAAQAREKPIRLALDASPPGPAPTRDAMRQAVAAYRQVVLRYPTSGYCDNALWLGAQLSAETFSRYGDEQDRKTAIRLLNSIVAEYPSSPLVERVRDDLARIGALASPAAPPAALEAPTPPRVSRSAPAPAPASATARGPVLVSDVRRRTTADGAVVEIQLDGPVEYWEEHLEKPSRVFVDLANTTTMDALRDATVAFESGLVKQIRVGRRPNSTTRIVIETVDTTRCSSRMASGPYRLLVSCGDASAPEPQPSVAQPPTPRPPPPQLRAVAQAAASTVRGAPASAPLAREVPAANPDPAAPEPSPSAAPVASVPAATLTDPAPPVVPAVAIPSATPVASAPAAPTANGRGGYSMARQLGLRVGRIVIDAGHGGRDPGAPGPGYSESSLTLDVALRLERLLTKEPGVEVVLTRRIDEYVALQERTAIANREGADLFVSIHANASRNRSARGVESYLLNFASTPEAAAVAARENASSTLTMSHLNDLVKQIALNSKLDESRDLAGHLQNALVRKLRGSNPGLRDLGVKQAPFVVLVGASMPSVLVEVAFLTHKQEGRLLGSGAYRQRIAEALLDGVRGYLRTLKRAETDAAAEASPTGNPVVQRLQ